MSYSAPDISSLYVDFTNTFVIIIIDTIVLYSTGIAAWLFIHFLFNPIDVIKNHTYTITRESLIVANMVELLVIGWVSMKLNKIAYFDCIGLAMWSLVRRSEKINRIFMYFCLLS